MTEPIKISELDEILAAASTDDDVFVLAHDDGINPVKTVKVKLSLIETRLAGVPNTFEKAQRGAITALTDAPTIAIDLVDGNNFSVTLGGNRVLGNPSNCLAGQTGFIWVKQDVTGDRVLSFGTNYRFSGGYIPVLSTAGDALDVLAYCVPEDDVIVISMAEEDVKEAL